MKEERLMNLTKKRWLILALCCLVNLCIGAVYAWSVFASPMAEHLTELLGRELTSGDLALAYTVCNGVGPITMISGGIINDKLGPKKVILIAGIMYGAGMFLAGFSTSVGMLIVTYGLIAGLGLGMAYGCTISTAVKYFPDKSGMAGGIATAVYGLSSVILPPIVTKLVSGMGITSTFKVLGIVFLVIIVVCSFFLQKCPDGFVPDGWTPPAKTESAAPTVENKNWKQMLSSPIFYVMIIMMMCGAVSGMMVISQASSVASNMIGMTVEAAAIAVSVLALFNAFGRIIAGTLSDKIGRINTLFLGLVLAICGLLILFFCKEGAMVQFYLGVILVGVSFGTFMGVYPGFTADRFGAKNNSVNYGFMFIGFALSGLVGPMLMKMVYGSAGVYQPAFIFAAGFAVEGIVLSFVYRGMAKKKEK